ncbi:MAG: aminotransferase class V-fold PLP-dependent enzyme [Rhizomicrobium sp.]
MTTEFRQHWGLDPAVEFLNHGSFGACPTAVLKAQTLLREEMELEPMEFFTRTLLGRLNGARDAVAEFVGADAEGLVFVPNASTGVNAVLRSLRFEPGDEILATDVTYCRKAVDFVADRSGARVVVADLPFPVSGDDEIVEAVLVKITTRTRIVLLDHVTSTTSVILPIARLVGEIQSRGIDVLVDGAHAPGMIPLSLSKIGAAYYTGNAHKWLCAPKGAAFLHVRRDRHAGLHPTVISHGYGRGLHPEFNWTGTCDPTASLCVPEAIAYVGGLLPGGWQEIMARNRALALEARTLALKALGSKIPCPDSMVGSMASVPLPAFDEGAMARIGTDLRTWFRERGVSTWFSPEPPYILRISAHLYNDIEQFKKLADLLSELFRPAGA